MVYSCGPCCDNTYVRCFTKYYMGDSCIVAEYGIYIKEKSQYECSKSECDEIESHTIYQDNIIETYIPDYYKYNQEHHNVYLEYFKNDTIVERIEILPNIDICNVDSIVLENHWFYD